MTSSLFLADRYKGPSILEQLDAALNEAMQDKTANHATEKRIEESFRGLIDHIENRTTAQISTGCLAHSLPSP